MRYHTAMVVVLCLLVSGCSKSETTAPPRPASVPATAVWAGGVDGGTWLDCAKLPSISGRYKCTAYDDFKGLVLAKGEYVIRRSVWSKIQNKALLESIDNYPATLRYISFDGDTIYLKESLVLVPDGWLVYPFEDGGKKQLFEVGKPLSEEIQYN